MSNTYYISSELIDLPTIKLILDECRFLELSEEAILNINKSKHYLDKIIPFQYMVSILDLVLYIM
jgi:histidine ammonia-lyase